MNFSDENLLMIIPNNIKKEKQERIALDAVASDVLKRLNICIDVLPQKYQIILQDVSNRQSQLNINSYDTVGLSLLHTENITEKLDQDYKILKLKQKNKELQAKIDSNDNILKQLREELATSKESLIQQSPNPDNIQDYIRQLRQKVASYEESCEKANLKFSKLNIPDELLPGSLKSLESTLSELTIEKKMLQQRAEDVTLARDARNTLAKLANRG